MSIDRADATVEKLVWAAAETIVDRRADWDRLDALTGDGDFGTTLATGAEAVLARLRKLDVTGAALLTEVAAVAERTTGGTSGPLWSAALRGAAAAARDDMQATALLRAAVEAIQEHGHADLGDKTMLDALIPAQRAVEGAGAATSGTSDLASLAAEAALAGAAQTRGLAGRRGRAAYAGARAIGALDPGAVAVATILARISQLVGGPAFDAQVKELHQASLSEPESNGNPAASLRTKQFVNEPRDAAIEALAGLARAHSDLIVWDASQKIVRRRHPSPGRVGLVSGGGSGHEPLHAGYVGEGMLTAAAPGPVFTSPTAEQILAATLASDSGAGVLHVVKNYTGDVINFGQARARALELGIETTSVLVADDLGSADAEVGRRGTGAALLVEKIAGARAESGAQLDQVTEVAERVASRSVSFGIALAPCSPPGADPIFTLGDLEIELGVGIHGERGARRTALRPAAELAADVAALLLDGLQPEASSQLLVFVNGLGATPLLELYLLYGSFVEALTRFGRRVGRSLVGSYVTSLDMSGASFTLLELDEELATLWDAPVLTPALRWGQ